jgi:hypothetical protein
MRARMRGMIAVSAAIAALTIQPARADLSLDIKPARYEFQADAGTSKTFPITVRNVGTARVHVVTTLSDLETNASGQVRFLSPGAVKFSSGKWSAVNPREFDLEPDAFIQVRYTVNVPNGVAGEYATLVLFTTRPQRKPGALGLTESVASRMYLVAGDAQPGGAIAAVTTEPNISGRQYAVNFKNTGSMHEYVGGHVDVTRDGTSVDRVDLPASTLVARGGSRTLVVQGKALPAGSYQAVAILDYCGPTRVAGKTTFVVR